MQMLRGVIRMVVTGGAGGDWSVDLKLGPGAPPAQPTTTVTIAAADADALERGELDPMQAFMSGKIMVTGDMTLMMQMQAIQMQAQAMAAAKKA
jgi:putative sterol carrier protein